MEDDYDDTQDRAEAALLREWDQRGWLSLPSHRGVLAIMCDAVAAEPRATYAAGGMRVILAWVEGCGYTPDNAKVIMDAELCAAYGRRGR